MMTKREIAELGKEFDENYYNKYNLRTEVQYVYRGQVKTRIEYRTTEEGKRIRDLLSIPMFICPECGEKFGYIDLEIWPNDSVEDIANDCIPCSSCYEDDMGEDL